MKAKNRLLELASILIFILTLVFLAVVLFRLNPGLNMGLNIKRLFAPKRTTASWSVLQEIKNLEEMETASYKMKVVFPYNFINGEEVDWQELKWQYDYSPETFLTKSEPEWYPDGKLPPEWKYAKLYALCRQAGIDPALPTPAFIVLNVSFQGGMDLQVWQNRIAENPETVSIIENESGRILVLPEPPVSITSFLVEDKDHSEEGFPDAPLSPMEWKNLIENLEDELMEIALKGGLLERAGENGLNFLREIFTAAGYDEVQFVNLETD